MTDGDTHRKSEDSRRMMLDSDIVALLLARLVDDDNDVRYSTVFAIIAFAKHGKSAGW